MDFGPRQGLQAACPGRGQVRSGIDTPGDILPLIPRKVGKDRIPVPLAERVRSVLDAFAA